MISVRRAKLKGGPGSQDLSRGEIRSLLRKGGSRNPCAFTQASVCYLDFLSEYYYLLGYVDETDRLLQIEATLIDCWKYAPYIKRVSDFERFLGVLLEKKRCNPGHEFESLHERLATLNHTQRFLLVARTYQNWTYRGLHLATRIKRYEITSALTELKCVLTGFDKRSLKTSQQILLYRINDLLEGELKIKESRTIEKELREQPLFRKFKADWLAYRCELEELKQSATFESPVVNAFKKRLTASFEEVPVNQPNFRDNLINQFSFTRIPSV